MATIPNILSAPQRLQENLSSRQLFLILDEYLFRAAIPLAENTPTFSDLVAELLAITIYHHRKLSTEQMSHLFRGLFIVDEPTVRQVIKSNKDRTPFFNWLSMMDDFGRRVEHHELINLRTRRERITVETILFLARAKQTLGDSPRIYAAFRTSAWWTKHAYDFRDQIAEKYLKSLYSKSISAVDKAPFKVELRDTFQVCYLITLKAISMYSSDEGVFTKYLNLWLTAPLNHKMTTAIGLAHGSSGVRNLDSNSYTAPLEAADGTPEALSADLFTDASILTNRLMAIANLPDIRMALLVSGAIPLGPSSDIGAVRN